MAPRDVPDASAIISGGRAKQPSKRSLGQDFSVALTAAAQKTGSGSKGSKSVDDPKGKEKKLTQTKLTLHLPRWSSAAQDTHQDFVPDNPLDDASARNADGSFKEAEDMVWVHSPSEETEKVSWPVNTKDADTDVVPTDHSDLGSNGEDTEEDAPKKKRRRLGKTALSARISSDDEDEEHQEECEADEETDGGANEDEERRRMLLEETNQSVSGKKRPLEKEDPTKDLCLCFKYKGEKNKDTGVDDRKAVCRFCLQQNKSENKSSFSVHITSNRRHLCRNHLNDYVKICKKNVVGYKFPADFAPPVGWNEPGRTKNKGELVQASMTRFAEPVLKKVVVSKEGIIEHLLTIITTCDLPYRFVERRALRRFILYLNSKLLDSDIPKKTCLAETVSRKVEKLDEITIELISKIDSKISTVWDGWSNRKRSPFTSVSISYIRSDEETDTIWTLKHHLIEFNPTAGRHTGEMIGKDLMLIRQQLGWMVGDAVASNDVAVRYVCTTFDPRKKRLIPKQVRIRCIDHSMHRAAYHFIRTLKISGMMATRATIHKNAVDEDGDEQEEDEEVDVSMEIEASADDVEAMQAIAEVDFELGDSAGKILAFINQVRMSSDPVRDYLASCCKALGLPELSLKLWVRTRWGSFSDCLKCVLTVQKGIDTFCSSADDNDDLPPLSSGKCWSDFKLDAGEWKLLRLAFHCLRLVANRHNELSVEDSPTCTKVYPLLEMLLSDWESLLDNGDFEPVHDALRAGIKCLEKYYRLSDETDVYFISHVLDPVYKLEYLEAAWDEEFLNKAKKRMESRFLEYKAQYDIENSGSKHRDESQKDAPSDTTDEWMKLLIQRNKKKGKSVSNPTMDAELDNPLAELKRWWALKPIPRSACPNAIPWWGYQKAEWPILRKMAKDYMSVPGTTCIAERSFSFSKRTDADQRGGMKSTTLGKLQKLRGGYTDGRLDADLDAIQKFVGDFDYDSDDYAN